MSRGKQKGRTTTKAKSEPKEELKVMYWKNPVFFMKASLGLQKGLVTQEAKDEFERLAIKTGSGSKLEDAVLDYDPEAKRKSDSKKRKGIE